MKVKSMWKKLLVGVMITTLQPWGYINSNYGKLPIVSAASVSASEEFQAKFQPKDDSSKYYKSLLSPSKPSKAAVLKKLYEVLEQQIHSVVGQTIDRFQGDDHDVYAIKIDLSTVDDYDELKISMSDNSVEDTDVQNVLDAICMDHPEWYWLEGSIQSVVPKKVYKVPVKEAYRRVADRQGIETAVFQHVDTLNTIIDQEEDSSYVKVRKIHDYLIQETIGSDTSDDCNIVSVFTRGCGNSEGYARAAQLLFNYYGIKNNIITAKLKNIEGKRTWNQVSVVKNTHDQSQWTNVDVYMDDLSKTSGDESTYDKRFNGISYRYFCRNTSEFRHVLSNMEGETQPSIRECSDDKYNQYMNHIVESTTGDSMYYYITSTTDINTKVGNILTDIHNRVVSVEDGVYWVRLCTNAGQDNLTVDILNRAFTGAGSSYRCIDIKRGLTNECIVFIENSYRYTLKNNTLTSEASKGKIYSSIKNVEENRQLECGRDTTLSLDHRSFYIKPEGTNRISEISYQIVGVDAEPVNVTLRDCLTMVNEADNVYKCTLPVDIEKNQTVNIQVAYTTSGVVHASFTSTENPIRAKYGTDISMDLTVHEEGAPLLGDFVYYVKKDGGLDEIARAQVDGGRVTKVINGDDGSKTHDAELKVGTHEVVVKYIPTPEEESRYTASIIASKKVIIEKADLHYTPEEGVIVAYGEIPEIGGTYNSADFKYRDTAACVTAAPVLKADSSHNAPGSYRIIQDQPGRAENYNIIVDTTRTMEIKKATPEITITTNNTEPSVGESIRITAKVENQADESLKDTLPSTAQLYLGENLVGNMTAATNKGEFYYDYVITNNAAEHLSFKVTTPENQYYTPGQSAVYTDITVNRSKCLVRFTDSKGIMDTITQYYTRGSKITKPEDPKDPRKEQRFVGWYLEDGTNTAWDFENQTVNGAVYLTARWETPIKTNITGISITGYTGTYDGQNHPAITNIQGTVSGDSITYIVGGEARDEVPELKDAGDYTVRVVVKRDFCNDYVKEVPVKIEKAEVIIPADLNPTTEVNYTGNPMSVQGTHIIGVAGEEVPTDTVSYIYYIDSMRAVKTSEEQGAATEGGAPSVPGRYYVRIVFGESANYKYRDDGVTELVINSGGDVTLDNVSKDVAANQEATYQFQLSELLGDNASRFGEVTYEVAEVIDDDSVLQGTVDTGDISIHNDVLTFKVASAAAGKIAYIKVKVNTNNYNNVSGTLAIVTKNKTVLTVSGVTVADREYNGTAFQYSGTPKFSKSTGEEILGITPEIMYTGTIVTGEHYESNEAPIDAGEYIMTIGVPASDRRYSGSKEYPFTITVKELTVKAKDYRVSIGAPIPQYTAEVTGLAEGDQINNIRFTCRYIQNHAEHGIPGDYDITPSDGVLDKPYNYHVIYQKGTLTVKTVHTIRFDAQVTGAKNPDPIYECEGNLVTMPPIGFTREGYLFDGWIAPDRGLYRTSEQYEMIDEDVTFVAKWSPRTTLSKITAEYKGRDVSVGAAVKKEDIKVIAQYTNGTSVPVTDFVVEPGVIEKEGDNVITVKYESATATILIKGYLNQVTEVTAVYDEQVIIGTKPNPEKLKVTVKYADGTTAQITSGYEVTWSTVTAGKNKYTLKYQGVTAEFEVMGVEAAGQAVLTFDCQGGFSDSTAVVDVGKTYGVPSPMKYGYVFKGWYTRPNGQGTAFTSSTIVTGSQTLYAFWEKGTGEVKQIYATYHGDILSGTISTKDFIVMATYENGSRGVIDGFSVNTKQLKLGTNRITVSYGNVSTMVILEVPSTPRELKVTLKDNVYMEGYTLTAKDLTVVATTADGEWKEVTDYTLKNQVIRSGNNLVEVSYNGRTETIPVEGRSRCVVTFDSNGGNKVQTKAIISGSLIGKLPQPKRTHYEFQGWFFDEDFTRQCTSTNKISKSVTLYAKWKKLNPYTINKKYLNLKLMEQDFLQITGADQVQWLVDDMNICGIDSDGVVTGINEGTTTITGYTADGYMLKCTVTVGTQVKQVIPAKKKLTMKKGKTHQLKVTVLPKKAATKKLAYSTSDVSVATVDKRGKIKAIGKGTCYIYIKTTDSSHLSKKIKVTVK